MKKNIILLSIFMLFLFFSVFGCDKKDRLNKSDVFIDITPCTGYFIKNDIIHFTARITSLNGKTVNDQVTWETNEGTISADGVYVVPNINNTPKTVSITARVGDIARTIKIRLVNDKNMLINKNKRYYFFADETNSIQDFKFDASIDDPDAGYQGIDDNYGCTTAKVTDYSYEGYESLKIVFMNPQPSNGIYFYFGTADYPHQKDFESRNFKFLKLALRMETSIAIQDEDLVIEIETYGGASIPPKHIKLTDYWQKWDIVKVPISDNLKTFRSIKIYPTNSINATIYIDNIYLTSENE
jgi:hypothetical protein